jgi:glucosamine--fructose-6-phosphate aminotransferase (isomerizing)
MIAITHMRREIEEIPKAVTRLLGEGRAGLRRAAEALRRSDPRFLVTVARGSSDHAAAYLKYAAEILLGLPVASVGPSVASVFSANLTARGGACLAISQSGKSPDLLAMMRTLSGSASPRIALCNDVSSPLMQFADHPIDILAGPEQSVAATKSFLASTVAGLTIFAEWKGDRGLIDAIDALPERLAEAVSLDWPELRAALGARCPTLALGRGPTFAMACEAALKLKETCAIHAEAYSSAEVMHGPVEIVDGRYAAICFAGRDAAELGIAAAADRLGEAGARAFVTSRLAARAAPLPAIATAHPLTDPLALIVTFYAATEALARALGRDPDRPLALRKVTRTM